LVVHRCQLSLDVPHLFAHMPTLPTHHTLFPYTTLFRSSFEERQLTTLQSRNHERTIQVMIGSGGDGDHLDPVVRRHGRRQVRHLDRKSTRLNSSHVKISYAVFCLKKTRKICGERRSYET